MQKKFFRDRRRSIFRP